MRLVFFKKAVNFFSVFPLALQTGLYKNSHWIHDRMTFKVEPGSCWLGYEIQNSSLIENYLPPNLQLTEISVTPGSKPKKLLFYNFFKVDCSFFKGHRLEIVTIARDEEKKKTRFVILDYLTDTISSDPYQPFKKPNCHQMSIFGSGNEKKYRAGDNYIVEGSWSDVLFPLSRVFAMEANEEIFYGHPSRVSKPPNSLIFSEEEVYRARRFSVKTITNDLWASCRNPVPDLAFYFPKAIHFQIKTENS